MQLWHLLQRDAFRSVRPLLAMSLLSGLAHVAVLTTMNEAIHRLTDADAVSQLLVMFLVANVLFVLGQTTYMRMASRRIERAILACRSRLVAEVSRAELLQVSGIGHARITEALGSEIQTISQAVPILVVGTHCAVVVALSSAYIYSFSRETFVILLLVIAFQLFIAWYNNRSAVDGGEGAHDSVVQLSDRVSDLMAGFREAKLNGVRRTRIVQGIATAANEAMGWRLKANEAHARSYTFAESMYYMSVSAVIFLLPAIAWVGVDKVAMGANAISFVIYPLHIIMASMPTFQAAEVAAHRVRDLDARLAEGAEPGTPAQAGGPEGAWNDMRRIRLEGLVFRHRGEGRRFTVGPLDLTLDRGEVVYITGGNGAGKSTLVHMLLGLYPSSHGRILVDEAVVDDATMPLYRSLFSVVFSDNHLTRSLLGVEAVDEALAHELLELMEIADKVAIRDGAFTTIELSGGQRKRLALVAALLERRPVIVLDEWAADQSPAFRRTFYTKVIPWMKQQGMTVIAVTHDDRYFKTADRVVEISEGRILPADAPALPAPLTAS